MFNLYLKSFLTFLLCLKEKDEHLELLEGMLIDLLKTKWNTFVKFRFYRQFILFACYFVVSLVCFILRPGPPDRALNSTVANTTSATLTSVVDVEVAADVGKIYWPFVFTNSQNRANFILTLVTSSPALTKIFFRFRNIFHWCLMHFGISENCTLLHNITEKLSVEIFNRSKVNERRCGHFKSHSKEKDKRWYFYI